MEITEALKNINYKDVIVRALWTFHAILPRHFTGRRKSSQLIIRGELVQIIRSDTSYCSVCNHLGWIICSWSYYYRLSTRQMKEPLNSSKITKQLKTASIAPRRF